MTYSNVRILIISNQIKSVPLCISITGGWAQFHHTVSSRQHKKCPKRPFCAYMVLTQFCMIAQLDPTDWYIKKQKLLNKADNYKGHKMCHFMLCTNNIAKIQKNGHLNSIVLNCILNITLMIQLMQWCLYVVYTFNENLYFGIA